MVLMRLGRRVLYAHKLASSYAERSCPKLDDVAEVAATEAANEDVAGNHDVQ